MSGTKTCYLGDIPVEVDYFVEDSRVFFESAYIDGNELDCVGITITRITTTKRGLLTITGKETIKLRQLFQEQLDEIEDDIIQDEHDSAVMDAAEFRRT